MHPSRCQSKYHHLLICHLEEGHEGDHYDRMRKLWWLWEGDK